MASSASGPTHLPIIDLSPFLESADSPASSEQCAALANGLISYGAVLIRDSRVQTKDNEDFLDLLEDYFAQPDEVLLRDQRPELGYQVGVTLENMEKPRCAAHGPCLDVIARLDPSERPLDISGHQPDPKARFLWKVGTPLGEGETEFPSFNANNVVPDIAERQIGQRWALTMNTWGEGMRNAVNTLSEMLAIGLDLPQNMFSAAGDRGAHLLAPTASDLSRYGTKDTILAGFHTDLNFLTIHGRSRYPGLNIWARNSGRRIPVLFGPGANLLLQAGKQLEHVTGGLIRAGYHEVVVNDSTLAEIERKKLQVPQRPLVRISSTLFWHLASDYTMKPIESCIAKKEKIDNGTDLGKGLGYEGGEGYPEMKVGAFVQR